MFHMDHVEVAVQHIYHMEHVLIVYSFYLAPTGLGEFRGFRNSKLA